MLNGITRRLDRIIKLLDEMNARENVRDLVHAQQERERPSHQYTQLANVLDTIQNRFAAHQEPE